MKNQKKNFFYWKRGVFDRKLCEESEKNSPNALQLLLFEKIGLLWRIYHTEFFPPIAYSKESKPIGKKVGSISSLPFFQNHSQIYHRWTENRRQISPNLNFSFIMIIVRSLLRVVVANSTLAKKCQEILTINFLH